MKKDELIRYFEQKILDIQDEMTGLLDITTSGSLAGRKSAYLKAIEWISDTTIQRLEESIWTIKTFFVVNWDNNTYMEATWAGEHQELLSILQSVGYEAASEYRIFSGTCRYIETDDITTKNRAIEKFQKRKEKGIDKTLFLFTYNQLAPIKSYIPK